MTDLAQASGDAFYRYLIENTGVSFIATDCDLIIRFWNAAASEMFGSSGQEMIGTPLVNVVPEGSREEATRLLQEAVDQGRTGDLEFQYRGGEGRTMELIAIISPIASETGDRIGASACVRDITHRMDLQTRLLEGRKMASLGQMAGAMTHHFNNILGGIVTSVDYAIASDNPAIKSRILTLISEGLGRATNLLRGLQNFAEGETHAHDLSDYTEIVDKLADAIEPNLDQRQIELVLDMPELPIIPVPRVQVTTVLSNIVQNAIEAMPGGGTLKIRVLADEERLATEISDTGCGLDEEALSHIFEPFWSTKDVLSGGTDQTPGLGLAIAHGIAQVLGGSISASSEPGKGSCFIFSLPRKDWEPQSF